MMRRACRILAIGLLLMPLLRVPAHADALDYPPSWSPPTVEETQARLAGLSFRELVDEAYRIELLFSPQAITYLGLAALLGVRNDRLTSYSQESSLQWRAVAETIWSRFREFDRETLSPQDRVTYDACAARWDRGEADDSQELFGYFLHPGSSSRDQALAALLVEQHPLRTVEDVVDYIARLYQVGEPIGELAAWFEEWVAAGGRMPRSLLEETVDAIDAWWTYNPSDHPFYRRFEDEVAQISTIASDAYETYAADAHHAILTVANRAFRNLSRTVSSYASTMPRDSEPIPTSCTKEAYADELARILGHPMAPEELHRIAQTEVERATDKIEALAPAFGRPEGTGFLDLLYLAYAKEGYLYGDDALRAFEEAVAFAAARCGEAFGWLPPAEIEIAPTESPNPYYQPPAIGESGEGVYWVPIEYGFFAAEVGHVTFHEVLPGHHLQRSWARREASSLIQRAASFTGFAEGWATYAEQLAWELGWYDDDPPGAVAHLYGQLGAAALTVIETGLFALEWDFDRIATYLSETISLRRDQAWDLYLELQADPVAYPQYVFGRVRILELREAVRDALGAAFSLEDFHTLVLQNGGVPLSVLEDQVLEAIEPMAESAEP